MPTPERLLSVIIPALDEEDTIAALLHDLADLRRDGHEVILVDGGSDDATVATAGPLVDRVVRSARGRALQMNAGVAAAHGDILWFVHADARVSVGAAERVIGAVAAGHHWGRFDVQLSGARWPLRVIEASMNLRSRLTGICTGDQGIFVDRATFDSVGGYPPIALMEDIALSKALRRVGRPCRIRRPRLRTSSRRWERHGILRTVLLMCRLRLAYALGAAPAALARRYR